MPDHLQKLVILRECPKHYAFVPEPGYVIEVFPDVSIGEEGLELREENTNAPTLCDSLLVALESLMSDPRARGVWN